MQGIGRRNAGYASRNAQKAAPLKSKGRAPLTWDELLTPGMLLISGTVMGWVCGEVLERTNKQAAIQELFRLAKFPKTANAATGTRAALSMAPRRGWAR